MKRVLLILLCTLGFAAAAQVDSARFIYGWEESLLNDLEERLAESEQEADLADELEELLPFREQKFNLNQLDAEVACRILKMTDYQYYQLQLYIELYGQLVTLYELAAVEGFDQTYVDAIREFVEVRPLLRGGNLFANFFARSKNMLLLRYGQILEHQAGYDSTARNGYLGNPMHLAFKYTFKSGDHFSMALAGEKDPGEQFFRGAQRQGFDHYSYFVQIREVGLLRSLVVGDYGLGFGQGTVMGGRLAGGKGGGAAAVRRFTTLPRATASMNEGNSLRGAAVAVGNAAYCGTLFYGHRYYDGATEVDSAGGVAFTGSLSHTGYHRTISEVSGRKAVMEHLLGAHFLMRRRLFEWGVTTVGMLYSTPLSTGDGAYRKFAIQGRSVANVGGHYKAIVRRAILFGEVAGSVNAGHWGMAIVQGTFVEPDPRFKMSALFRHFSRGYVAPNANVFAARSCSDETGFYLAADLVLGRRLLFYPYMDFYGTSWLRYRIDRPTYGAEIGGKLEVPLSRYLNLGVRYQFGYQEENCKLSDYYQSVEDVYRHRLRLSADCSPAGWLQLKTECALLWRMRARDSPTKGFLLCQDVGVRYERWNLGAKARFAFFNTDSYDERLYAYESDLLYCFTIAGYYGKGIRYYLMLDYGYAFFDLQIRFSQTIYDDRATVGSALTQIDNNRKSELKAQIIFHIN